jgi:hypothetical protein
MEWSSLGRLLLQALFHFLANVKRRVIGVLECQSHCATVVQPQMWGTLLL